MKVGVGFESRVRFSKLGLENRDVPAAENAVVRHVIGRPVEWTTICLDSTVYGGI